MPRRLFVRALFVLPSLAIVAAACGSSSKTSSQQAAATAAPATTAPPATTAAPVTTATTAASAGGAYGGGPSATTAAAPASTASISLANSKLGMIVVDSKGNTLYLNDKDTATTSICTGGCASAWPPATTTGSPTAGAGLNQSKVGTLTRSDSSMQITYGGHPLYRYVGDSAPGDTSGQNSGGVWHVVGADGNKIAS
jgi:predicted lipoprotein with Yx(FWY)xxD motif